MRKAFFGLALILSVLILGLVYQVIFNIIGGPKLYPTTQIHLNGTPEAINFTSSGKYLYVTSGKDYISKVNLSDDRVVSTIALNGSLANGGQPITQGGDTYVSSALQNYTLLAWGDNSTIVKVPTANLSNWENAHHFSGMAATIWTTSEVFAINNTNDTTVAAVQVPGYINEMISGRGKPFIYILSLNETGFNGSVGAGVYGKSFLTILNTQTNKIVATFLVGAPAKFGFTTNYMFLDSNGNIYLNGLNLNQTYIFSTLTNTFTGNIPVSAFEITGSPDGKYIYITPRLGQTVYIINASTNKIAKQVSFNNSVILYTAVSPNSKYLYISRWAQNETIILNAASGETIRNIKINNPFGVSFSSDAKYAYIWPGSNTTAVIVLNTTTNNEVTQFIVPLSVRTEPFYYQNGNYAYDMPLSNELYVYNSNPDYINFLVSLNYAFALLISALTALVFMVILRQNKKFSSKLNT